MLKCPFCQYENEDGALFCEQCKSDLSGVEAAPAPVAAESIPVAAVVEETIPLAAVEPVATLEPTVPVADVIELQPAAEPVAEAAPPPLEPPPAAAAPPAEAPAPAAAAAPAAEGPQLPEGASPKLAVIRGQRIGVEFPIYPDLNFIGRADEKPVDIDLEDQEPPDRIWCSRQHAVISLEENRLMIEDLNSSNGTYVNRTRVYPGQKRPLGVGDVIQIGTVQLKVKI
jgi:hypothetical protein